MLIAERFRRRTSKAPTRGDRGQWRRRGVAAVEFAVIAPLFFLLIIGIVEFGRALMVQQILTNASREGARRAVIEGATVAEVQTVTNDYLTGTVGGATVAVSPNSLDALGFGQPVTVSISVPFNNVSWIPTPWFLDGSTMSASTVMRTERLQ